MVSKETIQQCHHLATHDRVNSFVNSHEGEVILWTTLIQVCKIRAHLPFIVFSSLPLRHLLDTQGGPHP
jgi:hypothetical protein